ncbi:hypothetical protein GCM10009687_64040 [Asanoa iriomotensis]|uniref:Uncharacterized protein n=1 Tax=Asanoa iriomotensis TaxID=234613 RepID=A0ABQ4C7R9_9ACTN|nr:hypothetical protein Air01nite_49070 [Asanoa iriomotensis]
MSARWPLSPPAAETKLLVERWGCRRRKPSEKVSQLSILGRGDEHLHYSDSSHRWVAPPHIEQSVWEASLRAHLGRHLLTMGGRDEVDQIDLPRAYIPRQRGASKPTPEASATRSCRRAG